tara:strand:- start:6243 stop:6449 length:207 start_codon:yes stop_codon:yes gene_type:complete
MDLDEKREYHKKYNKAYYLQSKLTKQNDGNTYFKKISGSLSIKRNHIDKLLKANEDRVNKFRQQLGNI